ncbi:Cell division cycle protein 16 [Orobanche hederae]
MYFAIFGTLVFAFFSEQSKATRLDGTFAPGWIGYGNAYAAQVEGDQAMSAYRTAARLFPGRDAEICGSE